MASWLVAEMKAVLSMHIFFLALLCICLHILSSSPLSQFYVGCVSDFFFNPINSWKCVLPLPVGLWLDHITRGNYEEFLRRKNSYPPAATASMLVGIRRQQQQELWRVWNWTLLASMYPASFRNAGTRHETPGSEKKSFITLATEGSMSFMFTPAPLE